MKIGLFYGSTTCYTEMAAEKIQQKLGLPNNAFSYLKSHGALDQEHIKFYEGLMNQITGAAEQAQIIHSANIFYCLYGNIFRELAPQQALLIAA